MISEKIKQFNIACISHDWNNIKKQLSLFKPGELTQASFDSALNLAVNHNKIDLIDLLATQQLPINLNCLTVVRNLESLSRVLFYAQEQGQDIPDFIKKQNNTMLLAHIFVSPEEVVKQFIMLGFDHSGIDLSKYNIPDPNRVRHVKNYIRTKQIIDERNFIEGQMQDLTVQPKKENKNKL